jgi:hypothetical protein
VSGEPGVMGPIPVDPRDSDTLYVSSLQGDFCKSTDGGESWRPVRERPPGVLVVAVSRATRASSTRSCSKARRLPRVPQRGQRPELGGAELDDRAAELFGSPLHGPRDGLGDPVGVDPRLRPLRRGAGGGLQGGDDPAPARRLPGSSPRRASGRRPCCAPTLLLFVGAR